MTREEFDKKMKDMKRRYERRRSKLLFKFIKENNPYNVGDILEDNVGWIKVTKVSYWRSETNPCCVYTGTDLNSGENRSVLQTDVIRKVE